MQTYKVIDADYTPKFKEGEIIAKCYVQPYEHLCKSGSPSFYSLSSGKQQFAFYEDLEAL